MNGQLPFPIEALMWALPAFLLLVGFIFRKPLIRRLFAFDEIGQRILAEQKSSEFRTARLISAISPVLEGFPVDVRKDGARLVFIGKPVDYIYFDPDTGITLVEIKRGNSKLRPEQKKLKEAVNKGKVAWAEHRIR